MWRISPLLHQATEPAARFPAENIFENHLFIFVLV